MDIDNSWKFFIKYSIEKPEDIWGNMPAREKKDNLVKKVEGVYAVKGFFVAQVGFYFPGGGAGEIISRGRIFNQALKATGQNFRYDEKLKHLVSYKGHIKSNSVTESEVEDHFLENSAL